MGASNPQVRRRGDRTFFLVFTVAVSVLSHSTFHPAGRRRGPHGDVYAGGHISGGHYNPALTMAALWRGRIGLADAWRTDRAVRCRRGGRAGRPRRGEPGGGPISPVRSRPRGHGVVELLFTFALCYVVLNVATSRTS